MSTSPPPANPTATSVNTVIDDAVKAAETLAETTAETALDSAAPFFAVPVVKEVSDETIKLVIEKLGSELSTNLQVAGTFIIIDTQVSTEQLKLSQSLLALLVAEKSGDQNAIKQAIQNYADANSALIHDDGSSRPVT